MPINLWFPPIKASYPDASDEAIAKYFAQLEHAPEWDKGGTETVQARKGGRWHVTFFRWGALDYWRVTDGKEEIEGVRRVKFRSENANKTIETVETFDVSCGKVTYRFRLILSGWREFLVPFVYLLLLYELWGTTKGIQSVKIPTAEARGSIPISPVTFL